MVPRQLRPLSERTGGFFNGQHNADGTAPQAGNAVCILRRSTLQHRRSVYQSNPVERHEHQQRAEHPLHAGDWSVSSLFTSIVVFPVCIPVIVPFCVMFAMFEFPVV